MRIKSGTYLFLPERQLLFLASPQIECIWSKLRSGAFVSEILNSSEIEKDISKATLSDLLDAGALVHLGREDSVTEIKSRLGINLAGTTICLNFSGCHARSLLEGMLRHLETPMGEFDQQILIVESDENVGFAGCGEPIEWFKWIEAAPALKAMLTNFALAGLDGVALHAASLSADNEALLLLGNPGAGKSTLAVALSASGFSLEGDDIAALLPDGCVSALEFPATLKDGSWEILSRYRPDIKDLPVFVRPDGQTVRYLPLETKSPAPARRVRCVLCLSRSHDASARIEPLAVNGGIAALLEGAWSNDEMLNPSDFDALVCCVEGADFFRLTYCDLEDAVMLVKDAWRDLHR